MVNNITYYNSESIENHWNLQECHSERSEESSPKATSGFFTSFRMTFFPIFQLSHSLFCRNDKFLNINPFKKILFRMSKVTFLTTILNVNLFIFLLLILLTSCSPDTFRMNSNSSYELQGFIMTGMDKVQVKGSNSMVLQDKARVSLRSLQLTQIMADFTITVSEGTGLKFYFNTAVNNFDKHPFIAFEFSTDGYSLSENEKILAKSDSIKAELGKPVRIKLINDGKFIKVYADCAEIFKGRIKLPASEFVIVETLPDSKVIVNAVDFTEAVND
ncbi:MAG: hypothetical protein HW421_2960 [Ignavibacteria bacterium]|nr:hypothetical protein [Ignavibacteria bacterium]